MDGWMGRRTCLALLGLLGLLGIHVDGRARKFRGRNYMSWFLYGISWISFFIKLKSRIHFASAS